MRYRELFKIYNYRDLKRNKGVMLLIASAIFLSILVSLVIPQIQFGKKKNVETQTEKMNPAELMIEQTYPSRNFEQKLQEYEKNGVAIDVVTAAPVSIKTGGNNVMIYLMSGYDNLEKDEIVISKGLSEKTGIKKGDKIKVSGLKDGNEIRITGIENLPVDVCENAEIAGYIKSRDLQSSSMANTRILFLNGKNSASIETELKKIENGYQYQTIDDRKTALYEYIDKQIGALSLISSVGYLLSVAILLSGLVMLIIKNKKDFANLMLISIPMRDIKKALKVEMNVIIFIPLLLAATICIPLAMYFLKMENISIQVDAEYVLYVGKFLVFDILVFMLYRNLSVKFLNNISPVLVVKGENGITRPKIQDILLLAVSLPVTIIAYAVHLQSKISVSACIMLIIAVLILFGVLYILIELVARLPIWKYKKASLYAFCDMRANKLLFTLVILNLTMLAVFVYIGFNLANTLQTSVTTNYEKNVPYNYMLRPDEGHDLEQDLENSDDVEGFLKLSYCDVRVNKPKIPNKTMRINEIDKKDTGVEFKTLRGESVFEGDPSEILISDSYAKAYQLDLGDSLNISEGEKTQDYTIKGIYDAGGINPSWILKASENQYKDFLYLANFKEDHGLKELENCYIADVNSAGDYLLNQMNDFLKSFQYISIIYILAALVFNINLTYMSLKIGRKDYAVMAALAIDKRVMRHQILIKSIFISIISFFVSGLLYLLIMGMMIGMVSKGGLTFVNNTFLYVILLIIVTVLVGNIPVRNVAMGGLEEIQE